MSLTNYEEDLNWWLSVTGWSKPDLVFKLRWTANHSCLSSPSLTPQKTLGGLDDLIWIDWSLSIDWVWTFSGSFQNPIEETGLFQENPGSAFLLFPSSFCSSLHLSSKWPCSLFLFHLGEQNPSLEQLFSLNIAFKMNFHKQPWGFKGYYDTHFS